MIDLLATLTLALAIDAGGGDGDDRPATASVEEARVALDRALAWLLSNQREDGSWAYATMEGTMELGFSVESFYGWKLAASALACMALRSAPDTSERCAALQRGLEWLVETKDLKRGNDWDIDHVWGGLYGFVALAEASRDERYATEEWQTRLALGGRRYLDVLLATQTPSGGWAYYDDPIFSQRPKWATSFCTALVLPALEDALALGWLADRSVLERARKFVSHCALPNGAFAYDLRLLTRPSGEDIDDTKGSLARIQVCNWGLASVGERKITPDRIREGLESFYAQHRFLDAAFMRPIPHEAYYANSGYFYLFGHYYAARAIELLGRDEQEGFHARLRPHLLKVQREDGSTSDFLLSSYCVVAGTAYLALALELGLPEYGV